MKITQIPISEIHPYTSNPRVISDKAVSSVAESISRFGWQQPIVIDADGFIIVGHTRYLAAQQLGMDTVPVQRADELTPEQVRAYRLVDNKVNELTTWDDDVLSAELMQIELDGFDQLWQGLTTEISGLERFDFTVDETPEESSSGMIGNPVIQYTIIFDNEPQQQDWFAFIKLLKEEYPQDGSIASKISQFIRDKTRHGAG